MEINKNKKLGEIVSENFKVAEILESNNIDYCCGGDKTLDEACREKNVSFQYLKEQLEEIMELNDAETKKIKNMDASQLANYIKEKHHSYVREAIPELKKYLEKINQVHGANHPELDYIKDEFQKAAEALTDHMEDEEKTLFPVIDEMVEAKKNNDKIDAPCFGMLNNPISKMLDEHKTEGSRFDELSEKTNNFEVPEDGCNTFSLTYNKLREFVQDLHRHIHLENNILFPVAMRLEKEVIKKT
jgi:regulator of cell morphogenesis and NO signaling